MSYSKHAFASPIQKYLTNLSVEKCRKSLNQQDIKKQLQKNVRTNYYKNIEMF